MREQIGWCEKREKVSSGVDRFEAGIGQGRRLGHFQWPLIFQVVVTERQLAGFDVAPLKKEETIELSNSGRSPKSVEMCHDVFLIYVVVE